MISIVTPTFQRSQFLYYLSVMILQQDFPLSNIEWIVIDDSEKDSLTQEMIQYLQLHLGKVQYIRLPIKQYIGKKRNIGKELACGTFVIHMDDDDYYHRSYVSTIVTYFQTTKCAVVGSTSIFFMFPDSPYLQRSGPFHVNHTCGGCMAYTQDYGRHHTFGTENSYGEERHFLQQYKTPMTQLPCSYRIYIPLAHYSNSVIKTKLACVPMNITWINSVVSPRMIVFYLRLFPLHSPLMFANKTHHKDGRRFIGTSCLHFVIRAFFFIAHRTLKLIRKNKHLIG